MSEQLVTTPRQVHPVQSAVAAVYRGTLPNNCSSNQEILAVLGRCDRSRLIEALMPTLPSWLSEMGQLQLAMFIVEYFRSFESYFRADGGDEIRMRAEQVLLRRIREQMTDGAAPTVTDPSNIPAGWFY